MCRRAEGRVEEDMRREERCRCCSIGSIGPVLMASMTEYQMIEISNQQAFRDAPHMTLTPRIECVDGGETYTSLSDLRGGVEGDGSGRRDRVRGSRAVAYGVAARPAGGEARYQLVYRVSAMRGGDCGERMGAGAGTLRLIVPVVARSG